MSRLLQVQGYWWFMPRPHQEMIKTMSGGGECGGGDHTQIRLAPRHHLHAVLLTFIFLSLFSSLWVFSVGSSCAGFLKTWLPFLMLMGIILTVALTLNLRWPGRRVKDTVEPLQVECGVDLFRQQGGHHEVSNERNRGAKDCSPPREDCWTGMSNTCRPTHAWFVYSRRPVAGFAPVVKLQCPSDGNSFTFSHLLWEKRLNIRLTTTTTRTAQTHLMDYDYWKANSRFKPSPPAECRSCVNSWIVHCWTLWGKHIHALLSNFDDLTL